MSQRDIIVEEVAKHGVCTSLAISTYLHSDLKELDFVQAVQEGLENYDEEVKKRNQSNNSSR